MNDVRTLDAARRRRALARCDVALMVIGRAEPALSRSLRHAATAATSAAEAVEDAAIAIDVETMWERA